MTQLIKHIRVTLFALVAVGCTSGSDIGAPTLKIAEGSTDQHGIIAETGQIQTSGEEAFSEETYGVAASPRVVDVTSEALSASYAGNDASPSLISFNGLSAPKARLKRGGGRAQLGKPYTIGGRTFNPRHEPSYDRTGLASWYGNAFHGRLTANGEIYDMNHLSAAHPTLPLPSYVRVTNVSNGSSVIVRVNDRGPFAHNRIIDLSRRAALALGTTKQGVAKVNVKYIGPAPIDGNDDEYLLSSFRPGSQAQGNVNNITASTAPAQPQITIRRPSAALSYAENSDDMSAPQQFYITEADHTTITPAQKRILASLGETMPEDGALLLTLGKLGNANAALSQLWSMGFAQAMPIHNSAE